MLLRDSQDPLVSGSLPELKSGSWKVEDAVNSAEAELHIKSIRGPVQIGKGGFGLTKLPAIPSDKHCHAYRKLISVTSKEIDENANVCKALSLQVQGQWMRWENYVKNDLSWKSILALPPNLLAFCISSTYDVLPSPSNLKRWRITDEASCFLCQKNVCTTAHVLGACKVALSQGRFTFRHDSILLELTGNLTKFISELPTSATSKVNKIRFVKAGKYVPKTKPPMPTGLLHLAEDWILLSDLNGSYIFPGHIAISSLRPDIIIYSNSLRRVILIELTSPSEENMETWHSIKLSKYMCLVHMIEANGWCVDLFAIEVGARGYCSRTVTCCLKKLGYPNKKAFATAKTLGQTSMKASFCIWLARESKQWSQELLTPSCEKTATSHALPTRLNVEKSPEAAPLSSLTKTTSTTKVKTAKPETVKHAGFFNKGNTCYANSMLQALSTIPALWSQSPSEGPCKSPLLKAVSLNMSILNRASSPIDPSNFLRAQQHKMSSRDPDFRFNTQQDVAEILHFVLDEFIGTSILAEDLITSTLQTTTSCDVCHCSSVKEDKFNMLSLPLTKHISSSLNLFLQSEQLSDKKFCPQCSTQQHATADSSVVKCGNILILQLKRFCNFQGDVFKDTKMVQCLPSINHLLKVPITFDSNVSLSYECSLVATVNHSGTLNAGHYWAFIKKGDTWLECNDTAILKVKPSALNNTSCYVLFYVKK